MQRLAGDPDGVEESPWIKSSVSGALVYNTIDDMKSPHAGIFATSTTEVAGLGGDAQFVKLTARGRYYHTLSEELDVVGILSGGGGHIVGYRRTTGFASSTSSRATTA